MMRRAGQVHFQRTGLLVLLLVAIGGIGYEAGGRSQATRLVGELAACEISEVPNRIPPLNRWTRPLLEMRAEQSGATPEEAKARLHSRLALVAYQPKYAAGLMDTLLDAPPETVSVIRERLFFHRQTLLAPLRKAVRSKQPRRQLNAACALASYAPEDDIWNEIRASVAAELVKELARSPRDYEVLVGLLEPVRRQLSEPIGHLSRYDSLTELERETALNVLVEYAEDEPVVLCDVLLDADANRFERLFDLIRPQASVAMTCLKAELQRSLGDLKDEEAKERLGQRQANAGIALLRLSEDEPVWPLLGHRPDPRSRTWFIHRAAEYLADPQGLLAKFDPTVTTESDVEIQSALLQTLGQYPQQQFASEEQAQLISHLVQLYEDHPDAGIHASSEWLLRQWGQTVRLAASDEKLRETEEQLRSRPENDTRRWYVNTQGHTMVLLDGGEFLMGSPIAEVGRYEDETLHGEEIGYSFYISAKHVTVAQFRRFQPDFEHNQMHLCPDPECPILGVLWYEAAAYCNWLSDQEGIPEEEWCYEKNDDGRFAEGMRIRENSRELEGYRLPTEVEWEYACRAGTVTSRYYGQSEELLGEYAWYEVNSQERAWPVADLKPSPCGLFDMHGNAYDWCQDTPKQRRGILQLFLGQSTEEVEDNLTRVLRGGSFDDQSRYLRSGARNYNQPAYRNVINSFRTARAYN
jgi:formylglycine-generating enzyme required for sulfatase activity